MAALEEATEAAAFAALVVVVILASVGYAFLVIWAAMWATAPFLPIAGGGFWWINLLIFLFAVVVILSMSVGTATYIYEIARGADA